jgi:uncharacterized membrane protein HdeD (DUF308 family)
MTTDTMEKQELWWIPLLSGIASVIIGLLLLFVREEFLSLLMILLGLYWLVYGIFYLVSIFIDSSRWGLKLIIGILGIVAGVIVIQHPIWASAVVPATLAIILGIEGLIIGVVAIILAFQEKSWGAGILGLLSIVLGLLFLFNAAIAGNLLVILAGIFMLLAGIVAIVDAFRMRP